MEIDEEPHGLRRFREYCVERCCELACVGSHPPVDLFLSVAAEEIYERIDKLTDGQPIVPIAEFARHLVRTTMGDLARRAIPAEEQRRARRILEYWLGRLRVEERTYREAGGVDRFAQWAPGEGVAA